MNLVIEGKFPWSPRDTIWTRYYYKPSHSYLSRQLQVNETQTLYNTHTHNYCVIYKFKYSEPM